MKLHIFYATETGTAKEVAERIKRTLKRFHYKQSLTKWDLKHIDYCIFVCATTGQGDPPNMFREFWQNALLKSIESNYLSSLSFSVFGLGDSSYAKYNFVAKKLQKRLLQLGANCFHEKGEGDDQHYLGYDGAFDPWMAGLIEKLRNVFPLMKAEIPENVLPPPTYNINFVGDAPTKQINYSNKIHILKVTENRKLTLEGHFQDVRHVSLQSDLAFNFAPADVFYVKPRNSDERVDEFIEFCGFSEVADKPFRLQTLEDEEKPDSFLMQIFTLRQLCKVYFDICGKPSRIFFYICSFFTRDEQHKEKLYEFSTAAGQKDLFDYCYRPRRTLLEVLKDFHTVKIPFNYLFDVLLEMRPRAFSIASLPNPESNHLELCVAVVKHRSILQEPRRGVCSTWIQSLNVDDSVYGYFGKGTMSLPLPSVPCIFIATGTGIAPIRALIQKRIETGAKQNYLFFGCRNASADHFYADEFENFRAASALHTFYAFSRDQKQKRYVQHLISQQQETVWKLLLQGAYVFVCGNTQMPRDIADAFLNVFRNSTLSDNGKDWLDTLRKAKRWQEESW